MPFRCVVPSAIPRWIVNRYMRRLSDGRGGSSDESPSSVGQGQHLPHLATKRRTLATTPKKTKKITVNIHLKINTATTVATLAPQTPRRYRLQHQTHDDKVCTRGAKLASSKDLLSTSLFLHIERRERVSVIPCRHLECQAVDIQAPGFLAEARAPVQPQ